MALEAGIEGLQLTEGPRIGPAAMLVEHRSLGFPPAAEAGPIDVALAPVLADLALLKANVAALRLELGEVHRLVAPRPPWWRRLLGFARRLWPDSGTD